MARTALIAGASGLVGSHCLRGLRDDPDYSKVIVLGRRAIDERETLGPTTNPNIVVEQRVVDFAQLSPDSVRGADDVFCALGTTIAKAGSQAAFRRVDYDYIVTLAECAVSAGARRFVLVSSVGANARARNFYLRTKGQTDAAVAALPFEAVHILRPGLLLGARSEHRTGEDLAQRWLPRLAFLLPGPLRKYRAISAQTVACAMEYVACLRSSGVHLYHYDQIVQYGNETRGV